MNKVKTPSKWLIVSAMAVFLGTSMLAIAINSTVFRHGFNISWSISHYVGLEPWSAIFFTIANIFVAILTGKYLWQLGEVWKMPKFFYILIVVLAANLIGLSIFPVGMFDQGGTTSTISLLHNLTSRTMFIVMMLLAAMVVLCRRANTTAHIVNVLFLMYAVFCAVGFISEDYWFMPAVMIYETFYLFFFMFAMALCDTKREYLVQKLLRNK